MAISDNTSCTTFHCKWLMQNAVTYHIHLRHRSMAKNVALVKQMADSHQKLHAASFDELGLPKVDAVSKVESGRELQSDAELQRALQLLWPRPQDNARARV